MMPASERGSTVTCATRGAPVHRQCASVRCGDEHTCAERLIEVKDRRSGVADGRADRVGRGRRRDRPDRDCHGAAVCDGARGIVRVTWAVAGMGADEVDRDHPARAVDPGGVFDRVSGSGRTELLQSRGGENRSGGASASTDAGFATRLNQNCHAGRRRRPRSVTNVADPRRTARTFNGVTFMPLGSPEERSRS